MIILYLYIYNLYCHLSDRLCSWNLRHFYLFLHCFFHTSENCISSQCNHLNIFTRWYRLTGISHVKYVYCDSYSCMEMRVSKLSALARAARRMADGNTIFRCDRDYKANGGFNSGTGCAALQNFNKNSHQPSISRYSASRYG